MEKQTPHSKLSVIKAMVETGNVRTTKAAREGGAALGFDLDSMTTHADHRIWQDVYRPITTTGEIYLKLTVIDDVLIVSFKEL